MIFLFKSKSRNLSFRYKRLYIFAQVDTKLKEENKKRTKKKTLRGYFIRYSPPVEKKRTTPPSSFHLFFSLSYFSFFAHFGTCKIAKVFFFPLYFSFIRRRREEEEGLTGRSEKGGRARLYLYSRYLKRD